MSKLHIILMLLILFISCKKSNQISNKTDENVKLSVNNSGNLLFQGEVKNDSIPSGIWNFYNSNGINILSINFDKFEDSILIYGFEVNDMNGKLSYKANVYNGEITNEYSISNSVIQSKRNGITLFNNYCSSCHRMYSDMISIPLTPIANAKSIDDFRESYLEDSFHEDIPPLSQAVLNSIYLYCLDPRLE